MKVRAEHCDNSTCRNVDMPAEGSTLPYGWVEVRLREEGQGKVTKTFCSYECLEKWLKTFSWSNLL